MAKNNRDTLRGRHDLDFSFANALRGMFYIIKHHYNARLIFLFAFLSVALGLYLKISSIEMFVLSVTIMMVFLIEVINTLIEETIDLFSREFHPKIKIIKDVAAGLSLAAVCFSLIVAYFIFGTKLMRFLGV